MSDFWRISFLFFYGFLAQKCPKWPIPPKGKIFWVGTNGKVIALGVLVICPVDKNRDSQTKNWLLAQNTHFFWHGLHIFVPSGQLEPQYQHFQHERGVSAAFWQKRPNLAQNKHFWPNIGIFNQFDSMPDQKTMRKRCPGGFSLMWVPKFLLFFL